VAVTLILAVVSVFYASGFIRLEGRLPDTCAPQPTRALAMAGAILVVLVCLASPLADLSHHLASAHMTQHILLMLIAAPLFVWARPITYLLGVLPPQMRLHASHVRDRVGSLQFTGFLPTPAFSWAIFCGAIFLWHVPAVYRWAMSGALRHGLMSLSCLGAGFPFWSVVLAPVARRRLDYGSCALYVFSAALVTGLPGALITFARRPLYLVDYQGAIPFGLSALADQQLAGLIMWIPMDLILFAVALALMAAALNRNGRVERTAESTAAVSLVHPPLDVENAHRV
jgi:putative membrane protein